MAWVERPDGVRLAVQERGSGPGVLCMHSFIQHPGVYSGLHEQLARDFRVLTYHARGSGESTRTGPYDMATDSADLAAVLEAHGPIELVLANGEASHWAVHLAVARPELVPRVLSLETVPFRAADAAGSDALVGSATVLETLVSMIRADYRTGLHAAIQRGNPSLTEADMRERVDLTAAHTLPEAGIERLERWIADDASRDSAALGDRLTIAFEGAGAWFPASLHELMREFLPDANVVRLEVGAITAPEICAKVVRDAVRGSASSSDSMK